MYLRCACPLPHHVAELGVMLSVNVPPDIGSSRSDPGDLSLCDEPCSDQPLVLDDETLKAAIENRSQTCGELAERFQVSYKIVSFAVHREGEQVEQVAPPHTVRSQQAITCDSLFLVGFSTV